MPPQDLSKPIVVRGEDAQHGSARANPAISTLTFFRNFAAGYLVGCGIAVHPAGEECGLHDHRGAVELFVVLDGRGVIVVGDNHYRVIANDCVVVPPGFKHNLVGVSSQAPFRVLYAFVVAPGHEDDESPWLSTSA